MAEPQSFQQGQLGLPFFNASGEAVPPFACMELDFVFEGGRSATGTIGDDTGVRIKKPTADGARYSSLLVFNGPAWVQAQGFGQAQLNPQCLALWSGADGTPEVGWSVGAKSGEWGLSQLGKGFSIKSWDSNQAFFDSASLRTVLVEPDSNLLEIVRITSETKDEQGFYPGVVQRYDPIGLTWETIVACKVVDANA